MAICISQLKRSCPQETFKSWGLLFLQTILIIACLLFIVPKSSSQNYVSSNSFAEAYKQSNPTLNYKYDSINQIHNYSNNWDFDNDGINDEFSFIGTGGAHLYYYLQVILSSDTVVRNIRFLQSDFPVLPPDSVLVKKNLNPKTIRESFSVLEIQGKKAIYIKLDQVSFNIEEKVLRAKGIKSNAILIFFMKGKIIFKDFK